MKLNISDAVLAEIGKVVVVHNLIEFSLASIVGAVVSPGNSPEFGRIVAAEMSFRQLMGTIRSLLLSSLGEDHEAVTEFQRIKPLILKANDDRNRVVHSLWAVPSEGEPGTTIRIKTTSKIRSGLQQTFEVLSIEELGDVAIGIGDTYGEVAKFELRFQRDS